MDLTVPTTKKTAVLRCDFSDDAAWQQTWEQIEAGTEEGFQDSVEQVQSRDLGGADQESLLMMARQLSDSYDHPVVFFADATTMTDPERTLLVAWAWKDEYEGQSMRCLPRDVLAIDNNVIDNMPWEEFYENVGDDGVCRIE